MAREMKGVERIQGWGCSDCAWVFVPSGPPHGNTIDEMKRNFEATRVKTFTVHVCIKQSSTPAHVVTSARARSYYAKAWNKQHAGHLRDQAFAYCAFFGLPISNIPEVP